jgi:hypothetical protein
MEGLVHMAGEELFETLQDIVLERAIPRSEEIKFDKRSISDFALIATYCSILEQTWSILALLDKGLGYHAYPLLRCQLEGLADLLLLVREPGSIASLEFRHEKSVHEMLVRAKSGNPYLALISSELCVEDQLSLRGKRMKELAASGGKVIEPREKFRAVGLEDEADALYPMLCDHSHGGIHALIARHVRLGGDGDFEVIAFQNEHSEAFVALLQTSLDIVLRASIEVHEYFRTGHAAEFQKLVEKHSQEVVQPV